MKSKLLMLMILFCSSTHIFAQYDTQFWFAAPAIVPYYTTKLNQPIYLRLEAKDSDAIVRISQPANKSFVPITVNVLKESFSSVNLTSFLTDLECKPSNTTLNKGIFIESTAPIFAFYDIVSSPADAETYSLKGNYALGTSFVIPGQDLFSNHSAYSPTPFDRFYIVASEDDTKVTITPSQNILGHKANTAFDIVLNRGQVYTAEATSQNASNHLRGTIVISDKPVAITICDDLISFDFCQNQAGDQILPIRNFGTEFALVKGDLNGGDFIVITASEDNTKILLDDNITPTSLNKYQFKKIDVVSKLMYIKSDKPINVMHYSGRSCEIGVSTLIPVTCGGGGINNFNYSFVPTTFSYNDAVFMITVPTGHENDFLLDGKKISISFTPFKGKPELMGGKAYLDGQQYNKSFCLKNTSSNFSLGFIEGKNAGGAFGYFSDFGVFSSRDINLTGVKDIDFGIVPINLPRMKTMHVQNNSTINITIKSIKVKNNSDIFRISTTPSLPVKIPYKGSIDIEIRFNSKELKDYSDTLIIETDNPCIQTIYSTLSGSITMDTFVYLPDTTSIIGKDNFCIPLMLTPIDDSLLIPNLSYTAEISFDASMYSTFRPGEGKIISGKRYVSIHGDKINLTKSTTKLGEMCGLVLLSEANYTPLTIEDFKWDEPRIKIYKLDGSLTTFGVCQRPIRSIQLIKPTLYTISPNPASDFIEIKIPPLERGLGGVDIKIYNIFGQIVSTPVCFADTPASGGYRIDVSGLAPGMYFVRIGDRVGKFVKI